jgi:VanZ family protein
MIIKNKKAFFFWAAATFVCMAVIFWFSAQNAEQSGELSGSLTHRILSALQNWFGLSDAAFDTLEVLVRKTAHLSIFFVFGFCAANTVWQITQNKRRVFFISLVWCSFYAATDEWHQYFVPGRACMWQDWLIDTVGVLLGVGAAFLVIWLIAKIKRNRTKKTC